MQKRRIVGAVVLVASMLTLVRAWSPEQAAVAAAITPDLRSRPPDAVLSDGLRHVVVHSPGGPPAGVDARPMGAGDWVVRTELSDEELGALPGVEAVSPDVWADPYAADPDLAAAWGLENDGRSAGGWPGLVDADVDAAAAWDRSVGAGVVVAVIDTAVDRNHPELAGRMWRNPRETCGNDADDDRNGYVDDCDGWDFARNDNTPYDAGVDADHGTHIAGTIAAESGNGIGIAGVAPSATIMPLKVGDSGSFSLSAAAAAVNYAVANGADVINASWGTTGVSRAQVPWLEAAVERARAAGVLIVAAAGNDGRDIDASPSWPASFPQDNVITVGATTNADAPAYFSNRGATSVDVHAPGWFIWSTLPNGRYGTMSGTSMAAPHVAGAAALAIAADPSASYATVRGNLLATVDRLGALAGRSVTGGRVNAAAAVGETDLPVAFHVEGVADLVEGEPQAWSVRAQASVAGGTRYELSLATAHEGAVYAVSSEPLTIGGQPVVTDDGGWVSVPVGADEETLAIESDLPAGEYAVVVRLVDGDGAVIGAHQGLWFAVSGPAAEVPPVEPVPPVEEPQPAPPPPGGGYQPAPMPDDGQPVPTEPQPTAPCSTCGLPSPQVPVFVPPPPADEVPALPPPTIPSTTSTTAAVPWPTTTTTTATRPPGPAPTSTSTSTTAAPVASTTTTTTGPRPTTTLWAPTPSPTTTSTTAAPAPAPTTTVALPPAPAGMAITSVSPGTGPEGGRSSVVISGRGFPEDPVVRFGGAVADVSVAWPTMLLVQAPAHRAGTVDVEVTGAGRTARLADAYRYVADDGPAGSPPPPTPTTTAPATTSTTAAAGPTPTTAAPSTTTSSSAAPTTTSTTVRDRSPVTARGLRLVPVADDHPLAGLAPSTWPQRRCTSGSCAGTPIA